MNINLFKISRISWMGWVIVSFILVGALYKVYITSGGNFLFNMDNARDMVDIRDMVVLHKPRLIGPTSGIEGLFDGPFWYYLLAVPFIFSSGNPYAEIILMIFLWAIGGVFLYKLTRRFGFFISLTLTLIWISSNYIGLATSYAFNPNPVVLLAPLFFSLLEKSIKRKNISSSILIWFLTGLLFNFEMAAGLFMPLIIIITSYIFDKKYLLSKRFYVGIGVFGLFLMPQIIFYFKNKDLFKVIISNFSHPSQSVGLIDSTFNKLNLLKDLYIEVMGAALMNWSLLLGISVIGWIVLFYKLAQKKVEDFLLITICFLTILIPFVGGVILPINIMPWHLGLVAVAGIMLLGSFLQSLKMWNKSYKIISYFLCCTVILYAFLNINIKGIFVKQQSMDSSSFINEISAINYVYENAQDKNFKVYTYLPSVIDYPYQYLFWWYGLKKYGYTPEDYAYLPNQPEYIKNKERFVKVNKNGESDLVFLIRQQDSEHPERIESWLNNFEKLKLIKSYNINSIEVQIRSSALSSKYI